MERGDFARLPTLIRTQVVAYMIRNTSAGIRECYGMPLSELREIADGVSKIIEAENKG